MTEVRSGKTVTVPAARALAGDDVLLREAQAQNRSAGSGGVLRMIGRAFLENKMALVGLGMVVAVTLFCFVGPLLYHTDQVHSSLNTNLRPGGRHPLGTDYLGFDILGRLMEGGQSSIEIGLAVAFMATTFGVVWGAISGTSGEPSTPS